MARLAHERDRAVVIVTHDSRVLSFADRIIRIEDGRIADSSLAKKLPESEVSTELLTASALPTGGIHVA